MEWNTKNTRPALLIVSAVITLIGLITGWYLFIFLVVPVGWLWNRSSDRK